MKHRFLQGAAYSTAGMLYSTLAMLVAGKLMTNALPPGEVGQVALLIILGELLGTVGNAGLGASLPKLLQARAPDARRHLLSTLVPFQMISALSLALLCLGVALSESAWRPIAGTAFPLRFDLFLIAPALVLMITLRDFLLTAASGLHAYGVRAAAIILMSSLHALSFAALYVTGAHHALAFAVAYLIAGTMGTLLLTRIAPPPYYWDAPLVTEQIRFSLPLFVNSLLGFACQRLDTIIVVYYLGVGSAAVFEMAKRIPGVVGRFLGAGLVPYLPSISELLRESGREDAECLLQRASAYTAYTGFLATLVVVGVQKPLLSVLFTTDYQEAAPAVGPLLIAICLATQAGLMGQALIALERPATVMYINAGIAVLGIGTNLILIPHFGLGGAGWSAAAAAWFSYTLQRAAVARAGLSLSRYRAGWIPLLFVTAFLFCWTMNSSGWSLAAAVVFGVACIVVGSVSPVEIRALMRKERAS